MYDQMSMKEFVDPFTGEKNKIEDPFKGTSSRVQPSSLSHRTFRCSRERSLIGSEKTTSYTGSFIRILDVLRFPCDYDVFRNHRKSLLRK